jgi:hypothetical protein
MDKGNTAAAYDSTETHSQQAVGEIKGGRRNRQARCPERIAILFRVQSIPGLQLKD